MVCCFVVGFFFSWEWWLGVMTLKQMLSFPLTASLKIHVYERQRVKAVEKCECFTINCVKVTFLELDQDVQHMRCSLHCTSKFKAWGECWRSFSKAVLTNILLCDCLSVLWLLSRMISDFSWVRKGIVKKLILASAVIFILPSINSFYMSYQRLLNALQIIVLHLYFLELYLLVIIAQ